MPSDTHRADERRFLDERGSSAQLAPNGLNPATIMEKAVRERIVDSYFWKEQCFGVNEADVVDRVVAHVRFVGGTYGDDARRPSPFLCLAFKLLQLAPGDDVLEAYLGRGGDRFKYLRALACFYVRLTRRAERVFQLLEPFLRDRRKLRHRGRGPVPQLTFVDQFVDDLLTKDRVCATSLWQMPKRETLEDLDLLEPRVSPLGDVEELLAEEDEKRGVVGDGGGDGDDGEEGEIEDRGRAGSSSSPRYDERDRRSPRHGSSSSRGRMSIDRPRRDEESRSRSRSRRSDSR